jgi:hypothetical protein
VRADRIPLGIISLLFIAAGLIATLVTGNPRLTLMTGSLLTGLFGLAFLGSLLLPCPLAFYLGRQMMTGGKPELVARWDGLTIRLSSSALSALP